MSFEAVCHNCGAPSGPSVGVCPFCKSVMTNSNEQEAAGTNNLLKLYNEGKIERALALGTTMLKSKPDLKSDIQFVITFVKVLIETEAPSSQIRGLLAEASLVAPDNKDLIDYMEIIEAKNGLKKGLNDSGEIILRNVLRRSPNNIHAHFLLGTHLFWVDSQSPMAIPHLETCVRLHPNFLRAWGCLGALYKKMGNAQLAKMAFEKCATIETNPSMKEYFIVQAKAS